MKPPTKQAGLSDGPICRCRTNYALVQMTSSATKCTLSSSVLLSAVGDMPPLLPLGSSAAASQLLFHCFSDNTKFNEHHTAHTISTTLNTHTQPLSLLQATNPKTGLTLLQHVCQRQCLYLVELIVSYICKLTVDDHAARLQLLNQLSYTHQSTLTQHLSALHLSVAQASNLHITSCLLAAGADVNVLNRPTRSTPLHLAAQLNHMAAIELLLQHKANLHLRDAYGFSAYDYAARHANNQSQYQLLFVKHGMPLPSVSPVAVTSNAADDLSSSSDPLDVWQTIMADTENFGAAVRGVRETLAHKQALALRKAEAASAK